MIIQPNQLLSEWRSKNLPNPRNCVAGDVSYFCPTRESVQNNLYPNFKNWLVSLNLGKWYHKWDCDNFSDAFKVFCDGYYFNHIESDAESIAVGIIHYVAERRAESGVAGAHAGNLIYLDNLSNGITMNYFEPQNGRLYDLSDGEFRSISFLYV
jgi:hypothetical protein